MHMHGGSRQMVGFLAVSILASCAEPLSTREKGALTGTGLGAATGAIIGSAVGKPGTGAAIGGALGGLTGGLVGDQLQERERVSEEQQRTMERQRQELARNRELLDELKTRNLDASETERGVVVNLPDVLFEFAKATLTSEAQRKATALLKCSRAPHVGDRSRSKATRMQSGVRHLTSGSRSAGPRRWLLLLNTTG